MVRRNNKEVNSLTPKQQQVSRFIASFLTQKGYAPSLREIAEEFGFTVPTAQHYMEILEKKGVLRRAKYRTRAVAHSDADSTVSLPKLGYIAAGHPIEPIEQEEMVQVPASMVKQGQHYILQVSGDSMIEDGVLDGDLVVVKHQFTAETGEPVVAITEAGATLKILELDGDGYYLQPRNPRYAPIRDSFEIRGKVVGVIRNNG